jgi:hypothetical protein
MGLGPVLDMSYLQGFALMLSWGVTVYGGCSALVTGMLWQFTWQVHPPLTKLRLMNLCQCHPVMRGYPAYSLGCNSAAMYGKHSQAVHLTQPQHCTTVTPVQT